MLFRRYANHGIQFDLGDGTAVLPRVPFRCNGQMSQNSTYPASDLVFGYDFFISYSWSDAGESGFAERLYEQLTGRGFICFLDKAEFGAGDDLNAVTRRAVGKAGMLILIGTQGALESEYVYQELVIAASSGKVIIPVDVDGSLPAASPDSPIRSLLPDDPLYVKYHDEVWGVAVCL